MLRERGTENIVGIMKPMDTEVYKIKDEHELQYRKYKTVLTEYQHEMMVAMRGDEEFIYHPYLSDLTNFVLNVEES